jgi:glycosyltransferase involved in cell wall biosynthesis
MPQLAHADLVTCVSDEVARSVVDRGIPSDRVLVTPCTADTTRFHPSVDGSRVRREQGFDPSHVVFGWAGSFRRFHGLHLAIEAFAEVVASDPSTRLLLVGDGAERANLERLVLERNLSKHVSFTGQVAHEDMPSYLAAMNVALITAGDPNGFHYSPLKLREYLATAVPVIAPHVGQIALTLRNGIDALLYRPEDVPGLAAAMIRLADNAELRRSLGAAGREFELSTGGIERQIEAVLARIAGVLGQPSA